MFKVSPAIILPFLFSMSTSATVIHTERSLYTNIMVVDDGDRRCLKFNVKAKNLYQSCFYKSEPKKLVFSYTKLLFSGLLINDHPKNILIIGLGGGTMSNTLHELYPDSNITNIEIDPAVTKVAREYFNFVENNKVTALNQDGRLFVKRALLKKQTFDWIILDAFNGEYIPEHLMTQDFLEETKNLLTEDGILSSNTFLSSQLYNHESATYYSVFGDYLNVRSKDKSNRIILTSKRPLPPKKELTKRRKQLEKAFNFAVYDINLKEIEAGITSTDTQHDWPEDTRILTDQYSPANLLNMQEKE